MQQDPVNVTVRNKGTTKFDYDLSTTHLNLRDAEVGGGRSRETRRRGCAEGNKPTCENLGGMRCVRKPRQKKNRENCRSTARGINRPERTRTREKKKEGKWHCIQDCDTRLDAWSVSSGVLEEVLGWVPRANGELAD